MSQPTFSCEFICWRCEDREATGLLLCDDCAAFEATLDDVTRKCLTALRVRVADRSVQTANAYQEIERLRREIARLKGRRC